MKQFLVFGQNGQIASALIAAASSADVKITAWGRKECNLLSDPELARNAIIHAKNIDAVINAAAYTHVDEAETDIAAAMKLNADAPTFMAEACAERGIPFIHISTDYVFSGDSGVPYKPGDPAGPINTYGQSKAEGEKKVLSAHPASTIIRTSWVYDAFNRNFLTTMLRLAESEEYVSVVDDQIGRPSYAPHIADGILTAAHALCAKPELSGIYHLTGEGPAISWHGFAKAIFQHIDPAPGLKAITSTEFPTRARRPKYSVLDNSKFAAAFGVSMPPWETSLSAAMTAVRTRP